MTEFTFFWHDYETFGRQPRRDRPSQFAGVRTNADLEEIDEPVMVYCQPSPDYLPDPESCLLTGITPQHCLERGVKEVEFAQVIETQLARSGTVGVGYNTLRFDDEVTRHLFWRNLIEPYAREWQNGCGRWDLLDVVRCMYALRPQGLEWPTKLDEQGRKTPSFRLEDLTRANGLQHSQAHDALSDVRATIALARCIRSAQPRLWEFCLKLRSKAAVIEELGAFNRPVLHISGMYGAQRGCLAVVWPLAPHPVNKNEVIVWDLAHDPKVLLDLTAAQIRERMFTKAENLPEGHSRLPIKTLHLNRSPIVIRQLSILDGPAQQRWSIDMTASMAHAEWLLDHAGSLSHHWPDVFQRDPLDEPVDIDEDLYGGFLNQEDRRLLERVRQTAASGPGARYAFQDPRLDALCLRFRARNYPDTLTEDEQAQWEAHCHQRLLQGQTGYWNLDTFLQKIDDLHEEASEPGQQVLEALVDYATELAPD
jgi:exodeoxyribonuclease I